MQFSGSGSKHKRHIGTLAIGLSDKGTRTPAMIAELILERWKPCANGDAASNAESFLGQSEQLACDHLAKLFHPFLIALAKKGESKVASALGAMMRKTSWLADGCTWEWIDLLCEQPGFAREGQEVALAEVQAGQWVSLVGLCC